MIKYFFRKNKKKKTEKLKIVIFAADKFVVHCIGCCGFEKAASLEPRHEKTYILHMRKQQSHRSAAQ